MQGIHEVKYPPKEHGLISMHNISAIRLRDSAPPPKIKILHALRDNNGEFIRDKHGNVKAIEG